MPDRITITLDARARRCLDYLLNDSHEYLTATVAACDALPLLRLAVEQTRPENGGGHLAIVRPDGTVERIHVS